MAKSSQRNSSHSVSTTSAARPRGRLVGIGAQREADQVGRNGVVVGPQRSVGTGLTATVGSKARTVAPRAARRWAICRLGESRRSSVLALKVRPQTPTVTPSSAPPHAASTLATTRASCCSLLAMAPAKSEKS